MRERFKKLKEGQGYCICHMVLGKWVETTVIKKNNILNYYTDSMKRNGVIVPEFINMYEEEDF